MNTLKLTDSQKLRNTRRELRALIARADWVLRELDRTMQGPSTEQRGQRIAAISNELDLQNQIAKRYGLK